MSGTGRAGVTLAVIAKEPRPGRVKTRLCPPCAPEEAAAIAAAALADTLEAVAAVDVGRRAVAFEGDHRRWVGPGHHVVGQRGAGLDERLANAFEDLGGPTVIIGMDTPQVEPDDLQVLVDLLARPGPGAVLGPAVDGGFWAIGLRRCDRDLLLGVPMSSPHTGAVQRRRLLAAGIGLHEVGGLQDVDTFDDAVRVAARRPSGRFARAVGSIEARIRGTGGDRAAVAAVGDPPTGRRRS